MKYPTTQIVVGLILGLALPLSDVDAAPLGDPGGKCIASKSVTLGAGASGTLTKTDGGNNICPPNKPCELAGDIEFTFSAGEYSEVQAEVNGQTVPGSPVTIPANATSMTMSGSLDTDCETSADLVLTLVSTASPPVSSITTAVLTCSDCQN